MREMVNVTADGDGVVTGSFESTPVFPEAIKVGASGIWEAQVLNTGTVVGGIALGIENRSGNPGAITVTYNGSEPVVIDPGYILHLSSTLSPGEKIGGIDGLGGSVVFASVGSYLIELRACHGEPGNWITDEYIEVDG